MDGVELSVAVWRRDTSNKTLRVAWPNPRTRHDKFSERRGGIEETDVPRLALRNNV